MHIYVCTHTNIYIYHDCSFKNIRLKINFSLRDVFVIVYFEYLLIAMYVVDCYETKIIDYEQSKSNKNSSLVGIQTF